MDETLIFLLIELLGRGLIVHFLSFHYLILLKEKMI